MKKGIRKLSAILLALIMGLSFTYTSYPVYAQESIEATSVEQTENSVAKVGNTYYDDLAEALYKASETGEACDLLQDATITGDHDFLSLSPGVPGKGFDLKLNGFTIDGNSNLRFGADGPTPQIYGPGTINANFKVSVLEFCAPLTINGNITGSGVTSLPVFGSGVFRVNGDISGFIQGYKFGENVKVVCSGNFPKDWPIISKLDGNELINKNVPLDLKGFAGQPISTVYLPKDWSWMYGGEVLLLPGEFTWSARFDTTDYEMEYDFTNVVGYNQEEHYVKRNLTVNVSEEDIAKVVKPDGTEVLYSDIVKAFEEAENSTLYLLKDFEYDQRADSQLRALVPAKNMILKTNNYTLTCNGFYQYGNLGNPNLTIEGNGKDKIAVSIKDDLSNLTTTLSNAKIEVHCIGNGSLFVKSDSSVVGINNNSGEAPYLINEANLYLEDGAELIGTFEQPYDNSKVYTNVQPNASRYNLELPSKLELGKTYDLNLSEVFLNHSDIVDKGKADVSISGIDKEGYITMKSTGNHTVYLPISIDGISSLTNGTVILSTEHRNPEKDEALHYNGNGQDSTSITIGDKLIKDVSNPNSQEKLTHGTYTGTFKIKNNIDDTVKEIMVVHEVSHNYNKDWVNNETDHWHECDCGAKADEDTHSFIWVTDKEASHTEKGSKHEECKICGYKKDRVEIPVIEHTFSKDWTNDETKHWHGCDCGAKADEESHTFKWLVDKEATHAEKGSKHEECTVCKYKKDSVEIPVVEHTFGKDWSKDDTKHWHECDCGAKADEDTHSFIWVTDKEATHTEKGSKHEECSVCGYKKDSVDIPVVEHTFSKDWQNDETKHWHECDCGAKADKDTHTFKWVIDKEATEKEKGLKHEECSVCGYKKASVEIPVLTLTNPEKPNTDKPSEPTVPDTSVNDKTPETGDQTNLGLFAFLLTVSGLGMAGLAVHKKKKSLENR